MKLAIFKLLFGKNRQESKNRKSVNKDQANERKTTNDADNEWPAFEWRDFIAFWILGLCTEFGYIIMISASVDILNRFDQMEVNEEYNEACNTESPGVLLLADILPSLLMNLICPFLPLAMNIRMSLVVALQTISFLLVAFAQIKVTAVVGVMCTSFALGLGEVTLLSYSSKYNRKVIKAWASGTGGAGIIASFSYASLISFGIAPNDTLKVMVVMPTIEAIVFWMFLRAPQSNDAAKKSNETKQLPNVATIELDHYAVTRISIAITETTAETENLKSLKEKINFIPTILPFMMPLVVVFMFEYINVSGLFEMIHVPDVWLDQSSQYRWFQFVYQFGVFVSRSVGTFIPLPSVWLLSAVQCANVIYFVFEVVYSQTGNIWLLFCLVFFVGSVGGLAYVHTFWRLAKKVAPAQQKFSFGLMTIAETCGIALGGLSSIPIHQTLCKRLMPK